MVCLVDISKKKLQEYESVARGVMSVPKKIYYDFNASKNKDSILDSAVIIGINAAKRTSDMYPFCHSLEISSIHIDISPSDSILGGFSMESLEFLPSFKPKKFHINLNEDSKDLPNLEIQDSKDNEIIKKSTLQKVKDKFLKAQNEQIKHLNNAKKNIHASCGFITLVSVKSISRVRPDIEALNALNAVHLSLMNMLNTREIKLIEFKLDL